MDGDSVRDKVAFNNRLIRCILDVTISGIIIADVQFVV